MINIEGSTANEIFKKAAELLSDPNFYIERSARGLLTREIPATVFITLTNPEEAICTLKSRDINYKYLIAEIAWYLSGSLKVEDIARHSKFWLKLADQNGTINSNYGFLALTEKHNGKSQYEWCIDRLRNDPDSRQAVINYNQPKHKYSFVKDFVCTVSQQFIIRDGKLDCIVYMRSNDLIFGLSYDMPWFCYLHRMIADELELPVGKYEHIAASLHVYKPYFNMVKRMSKEKINNKTLLSSIIGLEVAIKLRSKIIKILSG